MKKFFTAGCSIFYSLGFFLIPFMVQGESVPTVAKKQDKAAGVYQVETLTVTAEKRKKNIQDVPMSISAFSGISIEDAGISNTGELLRFAPNVYLRKDANQNFIVIRGITSFYGGKLSPVGFYVDDVSFPLNGMHDVDLMDIERIEILKGPQGTLYGMNSEAGVVNIITRSPDNELRGKIFSEYNWYDTEHGNSPGYKLGGSISGPIVKDNLYLGVAGQWKDYQGFMRNEFDGNDEAGEMEQLNFRANLRWTPGDRWDISFITDVKAFDGGMSDYRFITGPLSEGRHSVSYDGSFNEWEQNGEGQNFRVAYEGDGFNVISITSRSYYKNKSASDIDCTSVESPWAGDGFFKDEDTTYSQEIRVSSPDDNGPLEWLTGLFLFDEKTDVYVQTDKKTQSIRDTTVDSFGYAFFGQGTYSIIDRLHLTAGLRFDHTDLDGQQVFTDMGTVKIYDRDLSEDEVLPKFSAAWDCTDDIMTYATIAKGYLYGGYNYSKATGLENLTFDPEYTWNYEIGAKSAWYNNRLTANMAAFYIKMKDKQLAEWTDDEGAAVQEIKNAADANSMGVELELQARPVQGLDLFANFGFTKSKIEDWVATEYSRMESKYYQYDYKDKKLPNVPEYTYSLGVQYRHATGFLGRVDLLGTGEFYSDAKNSLMENAYQLVNLRSGYEGENYDIIFWCKNVFDEEYSKVQFAVGADQMGIDGEPRMFGMTLAYRF